MKTVIIPMDVHSGTLVFGQFEDGKLKKSLRVDTSEQNLRKIGKHILELKEKPVVVIEETNLASWVVDIFESMKIKVVVSDPKQNKWISHDENKNDFSDCYKLGSLYSAGMIKEINKPPENIGNIRMVGARYIQINKDITSEKNRIKALLRNKGVFKTDRDYSGEMIFKQIEKSYNKDNKLFITTVNEMLNTLEELEKVKVAKIAIFKNFAKRYKEIKILCSIPGIKIVRATIIFAAIFNINRFSNFKKLNSYAGLGIAQQKSDKWKGKQHLNYNSKKQLKYCIKNATLNAIECNSYFKESYNKSKKEVDKGYKIILKLSRKMGKVIYNCLKKMKTYEELYPVENTKTEVAA